MSFNACNVAVKSEHTCAYSMRLGIGSTNDLLVRLMAKTKVDTLFFLYEAPGGDPRAWRGNLPWKTEVLRAVPFYRDTFFDAQHHW